MELGGRAPAIVFDDADVDTASKLALRQKFRRRWPGLHLADARFLIQQKVYDQFVDRSVDYAKG